MTIPFPTPDERSVREFQKIERESRGFWFTYHYRDENDHILIPDIECQVDITASIEKWADEPTFEIHAIWIDGINIQQSFSAHVRQLAAEIATAAESDEDLQAQACQAAGIVYRGSGYNDPDGVFVQRAL